MAQDSRDLSLCKVRKALAQWSPCLIDRVSPISNGTPLMECCRSRGCTEASMLAAIGELVTAHGADPSVANSEGQSPLILAAARGLARVVAFLLEHGADPRPRGFGSFRAAGDKRVVVQGIYTALGWTEVMIERERRGGVSRQQQKTLLRCNSLLREVPGGEVGGPTHQPGGAASPS